MQASYPRGEPQGSTHAMMLLSGLAVLICARSAAVPQRIRLYGLLLWRALLSHIYQATRLPAVCRAAIYHVAVRQWGRRPTEVKVFSLWKINHA